MSSSQQGRWAVFLDRDGTIIEEKGYISDPQDVVLLPTASAAIRKLNAHGVPAIVITNQAGVARGYFSLERVYEINQRIDALLREEGAFVDGYYICPHHPTAGVNEFRLDCGCRKPKPGMLIQAAEERLFDLRSSYMIGDKSLDLEAGAAAGCTPMLVLTGYGRESIDAVQRRNPSARVYEFLADAVESILSSSVDWRDSDF